MAIINVEPETKTLLTGVVVGAVGLVGMMRVSDTVRDKVVDWGTKDDFTGYSDGSTTFTSTPVEVVPAA